MMFGQDVKNSSNGMTAQQGANIIPAAIGFGTSVYDATQYDKNGAELLSEGGTSQ